MRATSDRSVTRPASRRSHRPASSSPRVSRVAVSAAHVPARTARNVPVRQTVKPPGSSRATGGPNRVRIAGFSASADSDSIPRAPSSPRYWVTTVAAIPPQRSATIAVPRRTWRTAVAVTADAGARPATGRAVGDGAGRWVGPGGHAAASP